MFKLKKILNKHNNAPEIEILPMETSSFANRENIFPLDCGELTANSSTQYSDILYVVLREMAEYDTNRRVECYRITPEMIFEVKCTDVNAEIGDKFLLTSTNQLFGYDGLNVATEGASRTDGYIVDTSDLAKNKTVLVRFHCKQ